jgi:hypothetical protein
MKLSTKAVTVSGLAALILAVPGTANAAQLNPVEAYTHADCSWSTSSTIRHKTDYGTIHFTPNNLPSGGLEIRLLRASDYTAFTGVTQWTSHVQKTIATGVLAGTDFRISHRKLSCSGTDRFWSGSMYY